MKGFNFRGYEIHGSRMWQQGQIDKALDFMKEYKLNALIFHENDLIDQLVFPEKYFDNDILWANWPVRRQGVLYRRDYINGVIKKAKKYGVAFYLEVKEISAPDSIFEVKPELRTADGAICPNNPFWEEFLKVKLDELFDVFPDIAGIIVSLGTRESPVSIAANRCHCDLCQNTTDLEWYTKVIRAMYEPIHNNGKDLIVRDFAYTAEQQSLMIQACEAVSDDIIIALKAEPHDYYPTFPDNPEIGNTGKLREYIEFDTWGQFFGMGVAPMSLAEDIQRRLINAYEKKADGVWFRTDWELINDACVHCTPSLVNLYAGAMLSFNLDTPLDDVYQRWISEGLYSPMKTASQPQIPEHPSNPEAWKYFRDFMKASWKAFSKIGYVLGHQYLESDQAPYTIEKAFEVMVVIHSRDDWDPGASSRVSVTKENMEKIFAEKQEGIKETKAILGILSPDTLGLSESFCSDIKASIQGMEDFAIFCDAVTRAMYLTSYAEKTHAADDISAAVSTEKELRKIADDFEKRYQNTEYPYYLYSRLHPARIRRFADNVALHISRIGKE